MCPLDLTKGVPELTDASPTGWYVRLQFSRLLDPSVEDLIPNTDSSGNPDGTYTGTLANTQPVTLQCQSSLGQGAMVDVPYDGYYSPAGNSLSYPLGPSLVIAPLDPTLIATSSSCQVTIKDGAVKAKDETAAPKDQLGPYTWSIAPIQVAAISPPSGSTVDPISAGADATFNTSVVFDGSDAPYTWTPAVPNNGVFQESASEFFFFGDFPSGGSTIDGSPYTFTLNQGAMLTDQCGKVTTLPAAGADNMNSTSFGLNPLTFESIQPALAPGDEISFEFNQYMDPASLATSEFTLSPAPDAMAVQPAASGTLQIYGHYKLGTTYNFTLAAGATIDDCPGEEFLGAGCVKSDTFTNPSATSLMFTTASSIVLNQTSPNDNTETTVGGVSAIALVFNQELDPTTFIQGQGKTFDITDANGNSVAASAVDAGTAGAGPYDEMLIVPDAAFPVGTYTFTYFGASSVSDYTGGTFTPGADVVIHFTLDPAPTPSPCL